MKNLSIQQSESDQAIWDDLEGLLTDEDHEEMDLQEIPIHMAALMVHCGKNRNQMAELLGVTRARITNLLNKTNIETKTIYRFTKALGYRFEVVFKKQGEHSSLQPWNEVAQFAVVPSSEVSTLYRQGKIGSEAFVTSPQPPNQSRVINPPISYGTVIAASTQPQNLNNLPVGAQHHVY